MPFFIYFLFTDLSYGVESKYTKLLYYQNFFGHIHRNPSRYSSSLTTISCGHPLKVLRKEKGKVVNSRWTYVAAGPYKGYILKKFLSEKRMKCFSDIYPKYFEKMKLSITEMYYFGRLYDQYVQGTSKRP